MPTRPAFVNVSLRVVGGGCAQNKKIYVDSRKGRSMANLIQVRIRRFPPA